jgi:hypothetical protein
MERAASNSPAWADEGINRKDAEVAKKVAGKSPIPLGDLRVFAVHPS